MSLKTALSAKVPDSTIDYCVALEKKHPFRFKITRARSSKLGDYRYDGKLHQITVNEDLNPYAFLITYLHEVAHRITKEKHPRAPAHGIAWKTIFQNLLTEVLQFAPFPEDILPEVLQFIANPKASSHADKKLYMALRQFDDHQGDLLADIPPGTNFNFRGTTYRKEHKRRTRSLCTQLATGRQYLISESAEIELI